MCADSLRRSYQCGVDDAFNPVGFPSRLQTDWANIYQSPATPNIAGLPWMSVLGNHDIPTPGGVDAQIGYGAKSANWILPARYYSVDLVATGVSMRVIALNTNPCVGKYLKTNQFRYGLSEEISLTGTSLYITSQMQWLNATLVSSSATGCGGSGARCACAVMRACVQTSEGAHPTRR